MVQMITSLLSVWETLVPGFSPVLVLETGHLENKLVEQTGKGSLSLLLLMKFKTKNKNGTRVQQINHPSHNRTGPCPMSSIFNPAP